MEPRHYTNLVIEKLDRIADVNQTVLSLFKYMSDDDVKDWAILNGILDNDEDDTNDEEKYSDEAYIAEYYYDPHEKLWRVDVRDESNNIVCFEYAPNEDAIKYEIECIASCRYNIIRSSKTSFYK